MKENQHTEWKEVWRDDYLTHAAALMFHPEPERFFTGEVTGEVGRLLLVCRGAMGRREMREALQLKSEDNFRRLYLAPALGLGLLEMTIPDKPNSRLQQYRLTDAGRTLLARLQKKSTP